MNRHCRPCAVVAACLLALAGCGRSPSADALDALARQADRILDAPLYPDLALDHGRELTRQMRRALSLLEENLHGGPAPAPAQPCDTLAGLPGDPDAPDPAAGVPDEAFNSSEKAEAAADACLEAVGKFPDERRFAFQLGRVLVLSGGETEGRPYLEDAAEQGSAAASFYLGRLETDPQKAAEFYARAAASGFAPAQKALGGDEADEKTPDPTEQTAAAPPASGVPEHPAGTLPLFSQRVETFSWSALDGAAKDGVLRPALDQQVESIAGSGAQVVVCSYGDPATENWVTYYFWYQHTPSGLSDMIGIDPGHPLRSLGFKSIEKAPANSTDAQRLREPSVKP